MKFRSIFDKVAWSSVIVLSLFTAGMIWAGDFTQPVVQYFNGNEGDISPQSAQFLLRFNRLMDTKSVESGFQIVPATQGQFSWSGRTFAFTAKEPLRYDEHYTITLKGARDLQGKVLADSVFQAHSTSSSLFFLDEKGSLNQLLLPAAQSTSLSSPDLFVQQFAVSPFGDMLAFLATQRSGSNFHDRSSFHLYILNIRTKALTELSLLNGLVLDNITWLPDNSGIAYTFVDVASSKEGLAWYDLVSQKNTDIAPGKARAYEFAFTPDGGKVAYIDTNGALILGDMPSGNGALVATVFNDLVGFASSGEYLAYIAPKNVNAFDLTNVPVLVTGDGDERKIPVPDSTSFDMQFFPMTKKLIWTLEKDIGIGRQDTLVSYDLEKNVLATLVEKNDCAALHPQVSPDETVLTWLCAKSDNKGYVLTGWNDYQGKIITGEIWMKDLVTGAERDLGIKGADLAWGK